MPDGGNTILNDESGKIPIIEKALSYTEVIAHSVGIPENGKRLHIVFARQDIAEVLALVHTRIAAEPTLFLL